MKKEAMSNVDAAWRHMEDPTNLMMVSGVMHFKDPISLEGLKTVLEKSLLPYDRFRQKVVDSPLLKKPFWEEDPDFSLDRHISVETLADPGDSLTFQERACELLSEGLDFSRPLWHVHLIDNVEGGNAIFIRIHHCIADGIALVSVLLSMTGETAEDSLTLSEPGGKRRPKPLSTIGHLFRQAGKVSGALWQGGKDTLVQPGKILEWAKQGTVGAKTFARLIARPNDPETCLKGPLNVPKKVAWSKPLSLEDVKAVRKVTGTTVNDVLLTAMTGGLRRYLRSLNQNTEDLNFHAAVPVNLRPPERMDKLGNEFGLVFLSLPVGVEDPLDRLWELKRRMDEIKSSGEAVIAFGMLKVVGTTPAEIQRLIVNIFGGKTTCVMTNVPGPKTHLYLGGKKIDTMMFWVPMSGRVGMGISILSYAGQVRLGIATDAGLIPEPLKIIDGFYEEMDALMKLVTQVEEDEVRE